MGKSAASGVSPAMQQYLDLKREYEDAILFFRMGDFYEMFFEDAKIASRELGLTLTTRDRNKKDPVPMAGIPHHAINEYLSRMLRAGYKVAICEQMEPPGKSKGPVRREVVQVVTPGTAMSEELLDAGENNYLVGLVPDGVRTGIAVVDVSTGEFAAGELPEHRSWLEELERIGPAEVLLSENEPPETEREIKRRLGGVMVTYRDGWTFEPGYAGDLIREQFRVANLKGFDLDGTPVGISAAGGVLAYLQETQKASLAHIGTIKRYRADAVMFLDARTRSNLEITTSIAAERGRVTLFSVLDHTETPMGGRLLKTWLTAPLIDHEAINARLDGVDELLARPDARTELGGILTRIGDVERLTGRVCLERANPRDLVALGESLICSHELRKAVGGLTAAAFRGLAEGLADLREAGESITAKLVDEPPVSIAEGGMFRDGVSPELDELRGVSRSGRGWIADLQARERQRTGIASLRVNYTSVFGYFIEVSKSNLDRVPDDYTRKQTLVNAERFITPELKEYEAKVLGAAERINELERQLFVALRKETAALVREIQAFSAATAMLDVLRSFAEAASTGGYVRPVVDDGTVIDIRDGRHPVVERMIPAGKFVSNGTRMDSAADQILIITGPNMAGKSTYLRQVGLVVLMAQAGSYVPASHAHIGVVDRIFTRVGASDNLAGGESTFLVEMNETAGILNNCTPRSLILFDEVGRGTSTFDGLSIAWAIVEYLHQVQRSAARTLFATHYHELTELATLLPRVKNYNVAVREWNDEIVFLRTIVEGGSDQSLGIQVARLAGLPPKVIARAKDILANLESNEFTVTHAPRIAEPPAASPHGTQISLFELPEHPVVEDIRRLDIDGLTPVQALLLLDRFKRRVTGDGAAGSSNPITDAQSDE